MKKIMFSDKYGLTDAVLAGRKTQTRRLIPNRLHDRINAFANDYYEKTLDFLYGKDLIEAYMTNYPGKLPYKVGEIVAVAQNYQAIYGEKTGMVASSLKESKGWSNKRYVSSKLMPHQIRITAVRVDRLQGILGDDFRKEGIRYIPEIHKYYFEKDGKEGFYFLTPRKAFAALIDKLSGKGTWRSNPYILVYDFELIK